jgi:anthranilate/para-aminobenzoate synthase component II
VILLLDNYDSFTYNLVQCDPEGSFCLPDPVAQRTEAS